MSVQAMAWAIEQQDITDPSTRLTLICLANYANADGSGAFPSLGRLARDTGLCERAVRSNLRKLERAVLIRRGNQAIAAAHIQRLDRRPTVYDLIMTRGAPDAPRRGAFDSSRDGTGGTVCQNGGHLTTERGAPDAPDPLRDPSFNPKRESGQAIPTGLPAKKVTEEERREFKRQLKVLASSPLERRKRSRSDG